MTTDRFAKPAAQTRTSLFTAAEYAAMAREKGLLEHARAWESVALERGEALLGPETSVRVGSDGKTFRVRIGSRKHGSI